MKGVYLEKAFSVLRWQRPKAGPAIITFFTVLVTRLSFFRYWKHLARQLLRTRSVMGSERDFSVCKKKNGYCPGQFIFYQKFGDSGDIEIDFTA